VDEAAGHTKRILDAKYKKADLKTVCQNQTELSVEQKSQLEAPLRTHGPLFLRWDFLRKGKRSS